MTFKLLSCDGGGIRGLITALLIQDLDKEFGIVAKADGFAGTSTGGLIALGLANGVPVDKIVDIYQHQGGTIFKPNGWLAEDATAPAGPPPANEQELESGPGVFSCQYTNTGVISIAGNLLGDTRLQDCNRFVAVNSARLWVDHGWAPATLSNTSHNPYRKVRLADAALATAAAPTYFPPFEISGFGYFADGGTFANNPAMAALSEAIGGGLVSSVEDLRMLSLGTGEQPVGIPPSAISNPLDWGVNHWLWPTRSGSVPAAALLNMTLDFTASATTRIAGQILGEACCRGNFRLSDPVALDDWREADALIRQTRGYMKTDAWKAVRIWVQSNWR